jgi:type IV pilus assembly protein PilQ
MRLRLLSVVLAWCCLVAQAPVPTPGAPIDLDFQGADLRAVIRALAEVRGVNVVIDPAVSGAVDVKLTRVPWDDAFGIVLRAHRLGSVIEGAVLRVAPLEVLAAQQAAVLVTRTYALTWARAADLEPLIKAAALSKQGDLRVDARTNTLVVRDQASGLDAVAALLLALDRAEPQVEIEARVVQTTRDSARQLGVVWGSGGTTTLTVSGEKRGVDLDVVLSALERSGKGRVLSTPRVTTQNNRQAEMTQGVQIPIQTVANNTVTVTFKDAALKLLVTPRITPAGTVIMDVELENATPDFARQVNNVPPVDTQRARTSVQVDDGATTVIGGIFVSRQQATLERTPGLWKVPLVGWLFRRDAAQEESRELLIFLTPRILRAGR